MGQSYPKTTSFLPPAAYTPSWWAKFVFLLLAGQYPNGDQNRERNQSAMRTLVIGDQREFLHRQLEIFIQRSNTLRAETFPWMLSALKAQWRWFKWSAVMSAEMLNLQLHQIGVMECRRCLGRDSHLKFSSVVIAGAKAEIAVFSLQQRGIWWLPCPYRNTQRLKCAGSWLH